jgi:polyhydroxyalkanoate synthesis regulator phasin
MRHYHDLGGLPAGPGERTEQDFALWEKRVEAMLAILARKGILTTDESRRALESLGADIYRASSYGERRVLAFANNMIQKGIVSVEEIARKLAEIERREEQLP